MVLGTALDVETESPRGLIACIINKEEPGSKLKQTLSDHLSGGFQSLPMEKFYSRQVASTQPVFQRALTQYLNVVTVFSGADRLPSAFCAVRHTGSEQLFTIMLF